MDTTKRRLLECARELQNYCCDHSCNKCTLASPGPFSTVLCPFITERPDGWNLPYEIKEEKKK